MNTNYNRISETADTVITKLDVAPSKVADIEIPADIPHGDMPGDKIEIGESHVAKAKTIFPKLVEELKNTMSGNKYGRGVEFYSALYKNVEVLDSGARGSTNTFVERGIGDVLIAWENEALLAANELGKDKFEIVTPSESILAEPTVSVVDKVVEKKGTKEVAEAYLKYLYSPEGQEIAAKNYYRPRDAEVAKKYENAFPKLKLFTIDEEFGGWTKAQKEHFANGGTFDQISKR